jgi:hypothetical protein
VSTVSSRLCCVEMEMSDTVKLLLFCVYMPCDNRIQGSNYTEYQDVLSEISYICNLRDSNYVMIAGDYNTDFARQSYFTHELKLFCENEHLLPLSMSESCDIAFTFESFTLIM